VSAASGPPSSFGYSLTNGICNTPTSTDMFGSIVKYTNTGYCAWNVAVGTTAATGNTEFTSVTCDAVSSVYACGSTAALNLSFYTGQGSRVSTSALTRRGSRDGIIVKYNSDGTFAWFVRIGAPNSSVVFCTSIVIDPLTQNVIVSGRYNTTSPDIVTVYTVNNVPSGITLPTSSGVLLPFTIELKAW
jgi:hypothetical protein